MIKKLCVTFFGSGYLPIAPGTWGSLAASIIFVLLAWEFNFCAAPLLLVKLSGLIILSYVLGVALGPWAVEYFKHKDPKQFVLDEAAGMWIALLAIPFTDAKSLLVIVVVQFFLFRIFDIIKPTPARQLEKLPLGWGIMTDDVIAGLYANIAGQILFRLIFPQLIA